MEERLEFKDDFIKDFVEKGSRTISNKDFENEIMCKIQVRVAHKKEMATKLKKSMYFFYVGLSLIGVYIFSVILNKFISSNATNFTSVLMLFFIIIIVTALVGNYRKFYTNAIL